MPAVPLLQPQVTRWECPRCNTRDTTRETGPHTRFHPCPSLGGLTAPMVREGERVNVVVHERDDYVGGEDVQYADGRPIQSITTEHADGHTDVAVLAPTAHSAGSNK